MDAGEAQALKSWVGTGAMVRVNEKPSGGFEKLTAGVFVAQPIRAVWEVLTGYERYQQFMPQTRSVKVLRRFEEGCDVEYLLDLKFSVFSSKIRYSLRYTHFPDEFRTAFRYLDGQLKGVEGGWTLAETEGGTLALYDVASDLRSLGFVVKRVLNAEPTLETAIQASSALMVVTAVKHWMERGGA